ncbi:MAG: serine hydrolase [Acidimicrobiales bacterium]|jgi:CubicO group peptidase (beta-lactamase class C family)|nr:serine hydrolase [Acidimicrobiales bacterium]
MTPEDLGFDSRRLPRIAELTHRYVDEGKWPCAVVAVHRRGEEVYRDVYGMADMERATPVADDTVFRLFSMSKPITSIGLLQLVERGIVKLEDPVSDYIPAFADTEVYVSGDADSFDTRPVDRPMQVVDLLRHTSGLTYGFLESGPVDTIYTANGVGVFGRETRTLEEVCDVLAELPLVYSPGDHWQYSISTDVCGRVIEVASGQQLSAYLDEHLTGPLGMTETAFWVREHQHDRLSANYAATPDEKLFLIDDPETSPGKAPPTFEGGGGGMVGTIDDYLRFCQALLNGGELDGERVIGRKTLQVATRNHLPDGKTVADMWLAQTFAEAQMTGMGFGLGFSVLVDTPTNRIIASDGEFAWGGAASTGFWVDPEEEVICVVMTQQVPSSQYPLRRELRNVVYGCLT